MRKRWATKAYDAGRPARRFAGGLVVFGLVKVRDWCAPVSACAWRGGSYSKLHLCLRCGLKEVVQAPLQIRQRACLSQLARTIAQTHKLTVSHVWWWRVARRLWPAGRAVDCDRQAFV
jgi:hypothetical protein